MYGGKLESPTRWVYEDGAPLDVAITLTDRKGVSHKATIFTVSEEEDLITLKITERRKDFPFVTFGTTIQSYDSVLVVGFPFGFPFTVTEGIVSNPKIIVSGHDLIQTDSVIHPGNSGGPLIRLSDHKVIGIVVGVHSPIPNIGIGLNFAIPTRVILPFLKENIKKSQ